MVNEKRYVFTEEWVQQIRSRYERQPEYSRPYVYFVATHNKYENLRDEIEKLIANLPQIARKKVIPKIQGNSNFLQTYHELVAGNLLMQLGYDLEYEKNLNGVTPDWYIYSRGEIPDFIIEVFTNNVSDIRKYEYIKINELIGRLEQIPIGVALNINYDFKYGEKFKLDSKKNKKIANSVKNWLIKSRPQSGEQLSLNGIIFKVDHYSPMYSTVQFACPVDLFWVNPKPLLENLKEKIKKYKNVVTDKGIPFVVCIFADFMTGLTLSSLQDVLLGQREVVITFEEKTKTIIKQKSTRKANGLFHKTGSLLSAVIWADKQYGKWKTEVLYNPNALNPLPITAFDG